MSKLLDYLKSLEFSFTVTWVILFKACIVTPGFPDAIFFLCAVANIVHERYEKAKEQMRHDLFVDQNLTSIQNQMDTMKAEQAVVLKAAEEAKKTMSELKMAQSFSRPKRSN